MVRPRAETEAARREAGGEAPGRDRPRESLVRQGRDVLDRCDPVVDVAIDGLATEPDLDRLMVEPLERERALGVPLDAHRARALALQLRLVRPVQGGRVIRQAGVLERPLEAGARDRDFRTRSWSGFVAQPQRYIIHRNDGLIHVIRSRLNGATNAPAASAGSAIDAAYA